MSRIDELIKELCPDGVSHVGLGEVGTFIRGNGLSKSDLTDAGFPAVHYGQIHTRYGIAIKETVSFTSPEKAARLRKAVPGDLLIATTSEDDQAVAKATVWLGDGEVALSGDAFIYHHSLEPKYISYFFNSETFSSQKKRFISGAKVRRISGGDLAKVIIPVPPLEIQREIVRILDQFTELEAELEARRRQYLHYQNGLIVAGGRAREPLGELANFKYGLTAKALDEGDIRFLRITDITSGGKLNSIGAKFVKNRNSKRNTLHDLEIY